MIAAITDPGKFHDMFIEPCLAKSKKIVEVISISSECPFVFLHDDLADANGPVFPLSWYDDYVFPHYKDIFESAKSRGKKTIIVTDGNMTKFLPKLVELGVDGFMCENPATPLEVVLEFFGTKEKFLIGGMETVVLSTGKPNDIKAMVKDIANKTQNCSGFAISSCGGLHADIPLENMMAYFDARSEIGVTPENWRNYFD